MKSKKLDKFYELMINSDPENENTYSKRTFQRQLIAHYGDRVSITSSKRNHLIVTSLDQSEAGSDFFKL